MMNNIIRENQDNPNYLKYLYASLQSYSKAKIIEFNLLIGLLFLAFAYPAVYLFSHNEKYKLIIFGLSILINILFQIFYNKIKHYTILGAELKNRYDQSVYNISTSKYSKLNNDDSLNKLSNSYLKKNGPINKWYPLSEIESLINISNEKVIAICQRVNLSWAISLRTEFASLILITLILHTFIVFTTFILNDASLNIYIYTIYSLQTFYSYFINQIRGHFTVVKKRSQILQHLDSLIFSKLDISNYDIIEIQNELFISRMENVKIPDSYYKLRRKDINLEIKEFLTRLNQYFKLEN